MIVMLLFLYPMLGANQLVGTDLTQAVPLTIAAALGALAFGHIEFGNSVSHNWERPRRHRRIVYLIEGPGSVHPTRHHVRDFRLASNTWGSAPLLSAGYCARHYSRSDVSGCSTCALGTAALRWAPSDCWRHTGRICQNRLIPFGVEIKDGGRWRTSQAKATLFERTTDLS